jgi:hypothetical protein
MFVTTTFVAGAPIDGLAFVSDVWSIGIGIFIDWQSSDLPVTTGRTMSSTKYGTIPSTNTQTISQPTSQNIPTTNSPSNTPSLVPNDSNHSGWSSPGAIAGYTIAGVAVGTIALFLVWRQCAYARRADKMWEEIEL